MWPPGGGLRTPAGGRPRPGPAPRPHRQAPCECDDAILVASAPPPPPAPRRGQGSRQGRVHSVANNPSAQPGTPHTNCLCQPRPWRRPDESAQATVDTRPTLVVSACGEILTFSPPDGAATVAARSWEGSHANPQPPPPATGQSRRSRANGRIGVGMGDGRPGRPLPCVGVEKKKGGGRRYLSYVGFGALNRRQHARARGKRTAPPPPARHGLPQGPLLHRGQGDIQEYVGRGGAAGWAPRHARAPELRSLRGAAPPAPIASGPNATSRRQKKRLSTATPHSRRQPGGQVGLARGAAFCE